MNAEERVGITSPSILKQWTTLYLFARVGGVGNLRAPKRRPTKFLFLSQQNTTKTRHNIFINCTEVNFAPIQPPQRAECKRQRFSNRSRNWWRGWTHSMQSATKCTEMRHCAYASQTCLKVTSFADDVVPTASRKEGIRKEKVVTDQRITSIRSEVWNNC